MTVDIYHVSHRERSVRNRLVRSWCNSKGIPRDENGNIIYKPDEIVWTTGDYPADRAARRRHGRGAAACGMRLRLPVIIKGVMTLKTPSAPSRPGLRASSCRITGLGNWIRWVHDRGLPECVEAANGKIPVLVDGGFRRGTDVFKALGSGRVRRRDRETVSLGLGAFGTRGIERVIELLRSELAVDMGMAGVAKLATD